MYKYTYQLLNGSFSYIHKRNVCGLQQFFTEKGSNKITNVSAYLRDSENTDFLLAFINGALLVLKTIFSLND